MADYKVTFPRSARRELEVLERPMVARILSRIETLAHEERLPGFSKLQGEENL